jgi:hypothetical protein
MFKYRLSDDIHECISDVRYYVNLLYMWYRSEG